MPSKHARLTGLARSAVFRRRFAKVNFGCAPPSQRLRARRRYLVADRLRPCEGAEAALLVGVEVAAPAANTHACVDVQEDEHNVPRP